MHGMRCRGFAGSRYEMGILVTVDSEGKWLEGKINSANLKDSKRIWGLVERNYIPIDWHLDFKSGFRWSEDTWFMDIPFAHKPGVDIKVPWELARMQHLPQLAIAYAVTHSDLREGARKQSYFGEFRNQILDFIATNPPRFGVNWRCTMDVAIRISNWLVAYDFFRAHGAEFDSAFKTELVNSVYAHGRHIVNNLEWYPELRGNHYLSNIVGLLFVSAYLPRAPEIDAWLAFAVQELINEVHYQFNQDGTNFEASTTYHCLSAEMVIYASAIVLGLSDEKQAALRDYDHRLHNMRPELKPAPIPLYSLTDDDSGLLPFPAWYIMRLEKMVEFVMDITKPNNRVPQIGDNDSGRFFKLSSVYQQMAVKEAKECYENLHNYTELLDEADYLHGDLLNFKGLIRAACGLLDRGDFDAWVGEKTIESEVIRGLAGGKKLRPGMGLNGKTQYLIPDKHLCSLAKGGHREEGEKVDIFNAVQNGLSVYPDFGLFIYKYASVYLLVRCGPNGQNGNGGHCHNDKLSIELNIGGVDFFVDGGSYIYTAHPEARNYFRATEAHNTLGILGEEQNDWPRGEKGVFAMSNHANEKVISVDNVMFEGSHLGFGVEHRRTLTWKQNRNLLFIEDSLPNYSENSYLSFNLHPSVRIGEIRGQGGDCYVVTLKSNGINLRMDMGGVKSVSVQDGFYSPGYGQREVNRRLVCMLSQLILTTKLRFP
jgi:hypothetical protein